MKGATCYEYQFGRLYIRILQPEYYFWPYKWLGTWRFPQVIRILWTDKRGNIR